MVVHELAAVLLAAPDPGSRTINTDGIIAFLASKIAPILLAGIAIMFIGKAARGNISQVLTSSVIAIIGLAFLAGATTLFFLGDTIVKLLFT